jgi:hypothetical protein
MRRRELIALLGGVLGSSTAAWPHNVRAQQVVGKTARIGFLLTSPDNPITQLSYPVFVEELKKSGFIEGQSDYPNSEDRSGQQEDFRRNLRAGAVECRRASRDRERNCAKGRHSCEPNYSHRHLGHQL